MKPFNLEKALAGVPVVTQNGGKVTEIVHLKTASPKRSIIYVVDGRAYETSEDGSFYSGYSTDSLNDLFMASKMVKKEGWINIYKDSYPGNTIYPSKLEADFYQDAERVACIKIEWEEEQE